MTRPDFTDGKQFGSAAWLNQDETGDTYLTVQTTIKGRQHRFDLYPESGKLQKGLNLAYKIKSTVFTNDMNDLKAQEIGEHV